MALRAFQSMASYTRERALDRVATGKSLRGANLEGINLAEADLRGADLRGANLSDTNLSHADLSGANLSGANLSEANLSEANLFEADFSEANLSETYLCLAFLSDTNFSNSNLSKADLSEAMLYDTDLSGANLSNANLLGAKFHKNDLTGANLSGTNLSRADIFNADLSKSDLSNTKLFETSFNLSNLTETNFSNAFLLNADLREVNLTKAVLRDANLSSVDFEQATLIEADISGANIYNIKTPGWKIDNIKCTHIYCHPLGASNEVRKKSRRNFREGEFEAIYKFIPTIELCFRDEFNFIDELRLHDIQEKLRTEIPNTNIELKKKERIGKDMVVSLGVKDEDKVEEVAEAVDRLYKDKELEEEFLTKIKKAVNKELVQLLPALNNVLTDNNEAKDGKPHKKELNTPSTINCITVTGNTFVFGSTMNQSAVGPGAIVDFSQNYLSNQTNADGLIGKLREGLAEDRKALADQLTEALKTKENSKAQEVWDEIKNGIGTGGTIVSIAGTLAKLLGLPM